MNFGIESSTSTPENYWGIRLGSLRPLVFPSSFLGKRDTKQPVVEIRRSFTTPRTGRLEPPLSQADYLLSAYFAYLSRILNVTAFDVGYLDDPTQRGNRELDIYSSNYLPLRIDLDSAQAFLELHVSIQQEIRLRSSFISHLNDVLSKSSSLKTAFDEFVTNVSVGVVVIGQLEEYKSFGDGQATILIPSEEAECVFITNSSVFDEDSVDRFLHHFCVFLHGAVADPSLRLHEIPVLDETDRYTLLHEFNNTRAEFPQEKLLHELFQQQAQKAPGDIAVVCRDERITYRDLNERSNQLARVLREQGVTGEQIVGLLVDDSSIEMIVGMLAILKAGGAFLPIDLSYPRERIEFMMKDSDVAVVLTNTDLKDRIDFKGRIVDIKDDRFDYEKNSNLERAIEPSNLAYIIYTSGSTGKPKGVQIQHISIVNQIFGLEMTYVFDSSLNHVLLAPITFDPSIQQIFLPLTSGGTLFLVPKSTYSNAQALLDFISGNKIDIINTVPSLMSALLESIDGEIYRDASFKYIILAGEVFSKSLYSRINESLAAEKILNIYGPTEATINTTLYECEPVEKNATIPIGKPLLNYIVYVLDEHKRLVPIGVPGEIYISGVGLARGYLNNPALTSERFLRNPYLPGEKMYRTGDLGRWTVEGNIEFLGRADNQVKVRGFRVELGEIEILLCQHPSVKEAVVIKQEGHVDNVRLVAYVIPNGTQVPLVDELHRYMKEKVPNYAVPSMFVILDALPRMQNGKVDRHSLPVPDQTNQELGTTYVPPRNEAEQHLVRLWQRVLGVQRVGVTDNFFELGGNSLLAMVLYAQIEKQFDKRFPLATIVRAPTVEKLANMLGDKNWQAAWSSLVPIQPTGSKAPFFFVHGHRGNVVSYYSLARYMGTAQPFYGLQAEGLDGKPVGARLIPGMAASYVKMIRTVQPRGPYYLGGWCMGGDIAFEMAQKIRLEGEEVALLAMIDNNHANYSSNMRGITIFHRLFCPLLERIDYELGNLKNLGRLARVTYILRKVRTLLVLIQVGGEKTLDWIFSKIGKDIGHSLAYRLHMLVDMHNKSYKYFKPKPYDGDATIFRASKQPFGVCNDPSLGWKELIKGELELREIPGHYINLFVEPNVSALAQQLKECLKRVQRRG